MKLHGTRKNESELDVDALLFGAGSPGASSTDPEQPGDQASEIEVRIHTASLQWIRNAAAAIEARSERLERLLQKRTVELRRAKLEMAAARRATHAANLDTIDRLVAAAESKDHDTAAHIGRIGQYSEVIARTMKLAPAVVATVRAAAPMHDVGKLGVPDEILKKTSPLNDAEWEIMKQHTVIGARMLEGSPSPLLQTGAAIALSHHEHWDGAGYPFGIEGGTIPIEARICSVADVYDALSSNRRYREALPSETVLEMMESQRGRQFDPQVLDAFLASRQEIEAIHHRQ